jgi:hypothetical protein
MAISKFGTRDWLLGWLVPSGVGTAAIQAVALTDSAGSEYGTGAPLPVSASSTPVTPIATSVVASSLVLSAAPTTFRGANVTSGASAGYVMLFDEIFAPADGTVTPVKTWVIAANSTIEVGYDPGLVMQVGAVLVFSTTGPYTKTASATAFISGEVG